jgi:hypothetical protein
MNKVHARGTLVGGWRLASWRNQASDGQVTYPMGTDALGYVLYTADGRFSITISRMGRLGSPPGTCSAGPPRRRPGPWRALLPTRARRSFHGDHVVHCVELSLSRIGLGASRSGGLNSPGPADPERQPTVVGGQAAGIPVWERVDPLP